MAGVILRILFQLNRGILPTDLTSYIINSSLFQLSFITVIEEAYFRGLLFGFLVMIGFKENVALIVQALLFLGVHYLKILIQSFFLGSFLY